MSKKISKILGNKKITGKEVGKLLVMSLIHDVKHSGEPDFKPMFEQTEYDSMTRSLTSSADVAYYKVYYAMYSSLVERYNKGEGQFQQFNNGFYRSLMFLQNSIKAEMVDTEIRSEPLIMSKAEYKALKKKAQEENNETRWTVFDAVLMFISLLIGNEEYKQQFEPIFKQYEEQHIENHRVAEKYNDYLGVYYTCNGVRKDEVSDEEWEALIKKEFLKDYNKKHGTDETDASTVIKKEKAIISLGATKYFFEGAESIRELYKETEGEEPSEELIAELLETMEEYTSKEVLLSDDVRYIEEHGTSVVKLNLFDYPIEEISKLDVLSSDALIELYTSDDTELAKTYFIEFAKEYSEILDVVLKIIGERIPISTDLDILTHTVTTGQLAEHKVPLLEEFGHLEDWDITDAIDDFSDRKQARLYGIALTDKEYNRKERKEQTSALLQIDCLNNLATDYDTQETIDSIKERLIKPALQYLLAYNAMIDILNEVYGIPDIIALKQNTDYLKEQCSIHDKLIYEFYSLVEGDPEDKKHKREILRDVFKPIYADRLEPNPDTIKAVRSKIEKAGIIEQEELLTDMTSLIDELMCVGGAE